MKPFDLERALAGDPVVTREGKKVLQIKHFELAEIQDCVVFIEEGAKYFENCSTDGKYRVCKVECRLDLFMAPLKKKVYLLVSHYPTVSSGNEHNILGAYSTKELALRDIDIPFRNQYQIVEIEVDE